jgi:hypothetical protein
MEDYRDVGLLLVYAWSFPWLSLLEQEIGRPLQKRETRKSANVCTYPKIRD